MLEFDVSKQERKILPYNNLLSLDF